MLRDPWFWAFWTYAVISFLQACYRMAKEQRDFERLRQASYEHQPYVTKDTMTINRLQLALRKCLIALGSDEDGPYIGDVMTEAQALLVGTDFEIL